MVLIILAGVVILFVIAGVPYLVIFKGYKSRDLLVLALFLYPLLLLGRFSTVLKLRFLEQWYLTFELSAAVLLVLFILVKLSSPESGRLRMSWPIVLLTSLMLVGLISGFVNGTSIGDYGVAIKAGFRWFVPLMLAWAAIGSLPKTPESNARLIDSYILVYGIITPSLILTSALFTGQMTRLMGWDPYAIAEAAGAGFTRGWTPTGSTITSGMLVLFAYSMALARLIRKHRVGFNAFVAVLCVIAIFFTLARSVMLSLVLLHLLAFRGILWKHFSRIFIALTVIAILLVPTLLLLGRKYGFERLVATKGASMEIRRYSAIAGLKAGLNKPVLGHGPGILYWDVRQPWGMPGTTKEKVIAIENLPSAKEPHNLYILIFAESGLIGLMLLIGTILFWLHRLRLARMYSELVPDYRLESNAHWSMLIILGVFSLTSASMFIYPKVALTMWLSLLIGLHGAATVENEMLACEQYEESAQDNYYGTEQYEHLWLRDDQYV